MIYDFGNATVIDVYFLLKAIVEAEKAEAVRLDLLQLSIYPKIDFASI